MGTHIVYYSKNSPFKLQLTDFDGSIFTSARMDTITKAYLKYKANENATPEIADSELVGHSGVFDWSTYKATGEILINLGGLAFTEGHDQEVELVIYDAINTEGRVQNPVLDIQISYEVAGDFTGAAVLTKAVGVSALPPITVTDADYVVESADFNRPSIRMVSASAHDVTLPVLTSTIDGGKLKIIIGGDGDVTLTCQGTNKILNSSHASMTGTDQYGSVELEACYALGIYVISKPTGKWTGN